MILPSPEVESNSGKNLSVYRVRAVRFIILLLLPERKLFNVSRNITDRSDWDWHDEEENEYIPSNQRLSERGNERYQ